MHTATDAYCIVGMIQYVPLKLNYLLTDQLVNSQKINPQKIFF